MERRGLIDLHTHTTFSDGESTPAQLVRIAANNGVVTLAVTDHDTVSGVQQAMEEAQRQGIKLISGIEFSTLYKGELHILGYNIDIDSPVLLSSLDALKDGRENRLRLMIDKLNEMGFELREEDIESAPGSIVGRSHIARAMLKKGYINSLSEAFEKYIGAGGPAYIQGNKLDAERVIKLIRACNGTAVLAHPKSLRLNDGEFEKFLISLVDMGLKGIEAYYPNHSEDDIRFYTRLCNKYKLVATGGTDYHGKLRSDIEPGVPLYRPTKTDAQILGLN